MFGRIQRLDNRIINSIAKIHKPMLNRLMILFSKLGTFGTVWWLICIPFLMRPALRVTGANIVFAMCFAFLMGEIILKHVVRRVRPCHSLDDEEQLVSPPRFYSFPSGHTTASFAVVGVVLLRCRPALAPILALACLIGFSRIYLRVHYFTDVIVGMLLGFACGLFSVHVFNAVAPVMLPMLFA